MNVADTLAAFTAGTLTSPTVVVDTASTVDFNFDALQTIARGGLISAINLSNGGRPTVAVTTAQAAAGAAAGTNNVLTLIATPYLLAQRTLAAAAATAVLANPFKAIAVVDSPTNIAANLAAIETRVEAGTLALVRMIGNESRVFSLSAAQVSANAAALARLSSPYTITLTDPGVPTIALPVWNTFSAIYTNVVARITTPFTLAIEGVIRPQVVASIVAGVDRFPASTVSGLPANPFAPLGSATATLLPHNLQVLESQSRISQWIASLEIAAQANKLASVTPRDGGVQNLSLTPAQLTDNARAASKFTPNLQLSQIIVAAQAALPPARDSRFYNYTVQDTAANIFANIESIDALAWSGKMTKLRFVEPAVDLRLTDHGLSEMAYALSFAYEQALTITPTDPGNPAVTIISDGDREHGRNRIHPDTPMVTLHGEEMNSFNVRNNVLNKVTGNYNLVIDSPIYPGLATTIFNENNKVLASLTSVRVSDGGSTIGSNLNALQALAVAGKLTAIDITNGGIPTLNISAATATANAAALAKITSPYRLAAVSATPVSISSADFMSTLASLETQAEAGTLGAITITDSPAYPSIFGVTPATLIDNLLAFSKITGHPFVIDLDGAGPHALVLKPWQVTTDNLAVLQKIVGAFTFSVSGALGAFQGPILANSPLLAKLTGLVTVNDYGNNFSNNNPGNLPGLQTLFASGRLGPVRLLDGLARFPLTAAQATANADVLNAIAIESPYYVAQVVSAAAAATAPIPSGRFTSLFVRDSMANVVANLAALEPRAASGELTSIVFTDATPVTMNISAATFAANAEALRLAGSYFIALTDPGTPTITLQNWQIPATTSIPTLLNRITTPFSLDIAGPITPRTAAALANAGTSFIAKIAPNALDIRDHPVSFQQFGNFMPQLLTLANAGKIASIDLRGAFQDFPLTIADLATYESLGALIVTPSRLAQIITVSDLPAPVLASGFDLFTIRDSVANVLSALPQIQTLAADHKLSGIFYTDPAPRLIVSAAEIMSGADALGSSQYLDLYPVLLSDPGTPVIALPSHQLTFTMRNAILDSIVGPWRLQISGRASAGTMAVIAAENNGVLAHLNGGVNVSGFSFEIEPHLDELQFLLNAGKLGSITVIDGGAPTITVTPEQNTELTGVLGLIGSQANIFVECFMTGTGIQTIRGVVPVETLRRGDTVRLLDGRDEQIVWIGQRHIDCRRHPNPNTVWPVRIAPGTFGPKQPNRELFLSPDHAVLMDDILIPIKYLAGGAGIEQIPMENVTYYHIELDQHEILLADGLTVESYLDTGNRAAFANGGKVVQLHTDFVLWKWESAGYAPLVVTGPLLTAARARLRERASTAKTTPIRSARRRKQAA